MRKRLAIVLLAVGAVMVLGPMTMAFGDVGSGDEAAALGFYDVTADATGVGITYGNPAAQPYPTAAGLIPHAIAQLGAGPSGHALASVLWPGDLVGNAGTLAALLGTPIPPDVASNLNDPVKAEAASSGGRDASTFGPMSAIVDGGDSQASSALADFKAAAFVSAARVVTRTHTRLDAGKVVSEAVTELQGVEIAGVIHIDSIKTTASGDTDGNVATLDHGIVITGVTVQGQGATIDESGIHLGSQGAPNPLDPAVAGANQAVKAMGMQAYVTKPVENQSTGGAGTVHSGAVVFTWTADAADVFTVVLGGAGVELKATPGSSFGTGGLDTFTGSADAGSTFVDTGSGALDMGTGAAPSITPSVATRPGGSAAAPAAGPLGFENASAVTDRVPLGWMLIGIAGMLLIGMGLHGLRTNALDAALAGTTCPLERGRP